MKGMTPTTIVGTAMLHSTLSPKILLSSMPIMLAAHFARMLGVHDAVLPKQYLGYCCGRHLLWLELAQWG